MINIENLSFEYFTRDENNYLSEMITAINEISFKANDGEFVAIVGRNGSGKSTFARILNRLLVPIDGIVSIYGFDALNPENIVDIRKNVAMIFQNPDDQIIGSIVEEEIAFGMENLKFSRKKMKANVLKAIAEVRLGKGDSTILKRKVSELSGGEKQKLAIAGALAMEPKCIVLDESTSMLDPLSRKEIIDILLKQKDKGVTIILITHIMSELVYADTIYVFDKGRICLKGSPQKVFSDMDRLKSYGLEAPVSVMLANRLYSEKIIRKNGLLEISDIVSQIESEYHYRFSNKVKLPTPKNENRKVDPINAILVDNLSYSYGKKKVIDDVNFEIGKGEFVALLGETSAGKTTLIQILTGLIKPDKGSVYIDGVEVYDKNTDMLAINRKIGFLFQYPEQQLFAKNVYEDVLYGVGNLGISKIEAEKRAYESIELVGLSQDIYDIPISRLSGGQKRRVALAGIIAMRPEYLILDEPTAGLDPEGRDEMMKIIKNLQQEIGITIIMVTHDIDVIVNYADRILLLENGKITQEGSPSIVLHNSYLSNGIEENISSVMKLLFLLRKKGLKVDCDCNDIDRCIEIIREQLRC